MEDPVEDNVEDCVAPGRRGGRRGTGLDHKRVYLLRAVPPWPNDTFV